MVATATAATAMSAKSATVLPPRKTPAKNRANTITKANRRAHRVRLASHVSRKKAAKALKAVTRTAKTVNRVNRAKAVNHASRVSLAKATKPAKHVNRVRRANRVRHAKNARISLNRKRHCRWKPHWQPVSPHLPQKAKLRRSSEIRLKAQRKMANRVVAVVAAAATAIAVIVKAAITSTMNRPTAKSRCKPQLLPAKSLLKPKQPGTVLRPL